MLHSEFIEKLNKGAIIHDGKLTVDKTLGFDVVEYRDDLLNSFIYSGEVQGVAVGVKPVSFVGSGRLNVLWSVSVLAVKSDGTTIAKYLEDLTEDEVQSSKIVQKAMADLEEKNLDVESCFEQLGMTPFDLSKFGDSDEE